MDMILDAAHQNGRAFQSLGNFAEMSVQGNSETGVSEPRATIFGGEDQVDVNDREGLRHGRSELGATPLGLCREAAGYPG